MNALDWRLKSTLRNGKKGINVTLIAEKPSIAKVIADALSKGKGQSNSVCLWCKTNKKMKKCRHALTNHYYYGKFRGIDAYFNVISVYGHIYQKHYSKWSKSYDIDPLNLLEDKIEDFLAEKDHRQQREYKEMGYLEQFLIEYITDTDWLLLWLDNDIAGENICFQIKRLITKYKINFNQENILRAVFSSLSHIDINNCYDNLHLKPDEAKSISYDWREEVDLRIGQAFTYYLTNQLRRTFTEKLEEKRFSYGPCQFPTFWFCYQRFLEIQNYVPEQYWQIKAILTLEDNSKVVVTCTEKYETKEGAEYMAKNIRHIKFATKEGSKIYKQTIEKPEPMNTIDLLVEAAKRLNLDSRSTSNYAQKIYVKGVITYPRTSSRKYNRELNISKILDSYAGVEKYKEIVRKLLSKSSINSSFLEDDEYQDHPPITPNPQGSRNAKFKPGTWMAKLHDLIMRHFFATIHDDAIVKQVFTSFKIGNLSFTEMHSFFTQKGFTEIYELDKSTSEKLNISNIDFPNISYKIESLRVEKYIEPPKEYMTEAELIKKMEEHKIGTDGTIPSHISKIIGRRYVIKVNNGDMIKRLKPTPLGLALAEGFGTIDQELIKPIVRNHIERCCRKVCDYEMTKNNVVEHLLDKFRSKLIRFKAEFYHIKDKVRAIGSYQIAVQKVDAKEQKIKNEIHEIEQYDA